MKKQLIGLFLGAALVFSATTVQAQILEVFGEYPFTYKFDEGSSESASGYVLGVRSFAIPAGLGMESYRVKTTSGHMDVQMYNLFYASAFPLIQIALGIGVGKGSFDDTTGASYDNPALIQYYFNLGYPIMPLFGVFLGMHLVDGSAGSKVTGVPDLNVSGRMTSLGLRFGF